MNWQRGRTHTQIARILLPTVVLLFFLSGVPTAGAAAEESEPWYGWFWPLGERVEVENLKDEYVPFKSLGDIPQRPELLLELGDPFLDTGLLDEGFEVPIIGAVWQPRLWASK